MMEVKTITTITYNPTDNIEQAAFMEMKSTLLNSGFKLLDVSKPTLGNEIEVTFKMAISE
ncbi:hypothetical protein 0105phi72_082 [Bacillus phage 0105phi7-2]|uniref:Uncharacterized protein n=1 Tax=Bacillus phage 0105phi7-2 TaxID=3025408 RepID=A0AAE9YAR6_9CAUD|nr:hypothetical protein P9653_gp80 [Bacillus phage 0105phi7-2]WCS66626.1 hypothetical protein 0105phi72_082 [Bacillus phage 0105phi7-2]